MTPALGDRLAGAVWGHLVGDALGVPYEFQPASAIGDVRWGITGGTHRQPPGSWSDDGGLMLATLDSLLTVGFDPDDQGRRFLSWYEGAEYKPGPLFDVGNATSAALRRLRAGTPAIEAGGAEEWDNGNGSLMRILPIALVDREISVGELVHRAMTSSSITHRHLRSQVACAVYCCMARLLLGGRDPDGVLEDAVQDAATVMPAAAQAELHDLSSYPQREGSGYVVDTLLSAYDALRSASSYPEAVTAAIRYGNDTDTTACVAGGLAGIWWGVQGIPAEWLEGMRGRDLVNPLVEQLIEAG